MNEMPTESNQEEEQEQQNQYEDYIKDNPPMEIAKENLIECEPEIAEFKEMMFLFEETHSLEELNSIINITPELETLFKKDREMSAEEIEAAIKNLSAEEVWAYEARVRAKKDLTLILLKRDKLEKETNISSERYQELKIKYQRLNRAVGLINGGKIDHTR